MTHTARIYGSSLYDLAAEENLTEVMMEQTGQVRELFRENPEYVQLLSEPSIPKEERTGLIETAFGTQAERYLVNFLKLLCERNILREFAGCCDEFTRRYNADHNIAEAVVTSAVTLDEAQMKALKDKLEQISGRNVAAQCRQIDPAVLGGIRVELDGKQLDGTVTRPVWHGISRKLNEVIM